MFLHHAAGHDDFGGVERELARGVPVDARSGGKTPLMRAAERPTASTAMLRFLVERGADVNAVDDLGLHTPLERAAHRAQAEKVRFLLEAGARVDQTTGSGATALLSAAYSFFLPAADPAPRLEVMRRLLAEGADPDAHTGYCESPLGVSASAGAFDAVRLLLASGADPARLAWTELMHAIALGTVEEAAATLESADTQARDRWERTPWLLAIATGEIPKARLLWERGASLDERGPCGKHSLMYPAERDHVEILEWLIGLGADIEARDDFGDTPLLYAAERGAARCVRALLAAGADPHVEDDLQDRPINEAGTLEVVRLLLEAGADINYVPGTGYTLLKSAAEDGDEERVAGLIAFGAAPDVAGAGEQALHKAATMDELGIIRLLLDAGADPNAPDWDDEPPLFRVSSPEAARLLLEAGADPNYRDPVINQSLRDWLVTSECDPRVLAVLDEYRPRRWWRFGR